MAGRETIYAVAVAIVTVFFSVAAHGISAAPLANWYGERQDALRWQAIAEEFPMTIIAGYTFDTAEGAGQLLDLIRDLSRQGLISVEDAALATWPEGKKQCTIKILGDLTGPGALNRTCWGLLFGLVSHSLAWAQRSVPLWVSVSERWRR